MPGQSHQGPLPPTTEAQRRLASELRRDVEELAGRIGERNMEAPGALREAEVHLARELANAGHDVRRHPYTVRQVGCVNLDAEVTGSRIPDEIALIGAHYDSLRGTTGANDNASGVAAVLALARRFAARPGRRTLRFALFVNEEPPHYWSDAMGSLVYARACRQRGENIMAMLTPETIGYYSDAPGSQSYPLAVPALPSAGNFIMFVGMAEARDLVRRCVGAFRRDTRFPCYGAAAPVEVPWVGASDHWSFWKNGYPALMVTDTAPLRYPHYHTSADTPDKIDYDRMARVVEGLERVLLDLVHGP
jgi:Zn-dependent M28 family amino/carboxypeptidase